MFWCSRPTLRLRACGVEVLWLPGKPLDLHVAMIELADRKVTSVLAEAGSAVNGALLQADLVDRVVLYYAERELGFGAVPFAAHCESPYALQQRLTQTTRATFPSDVAPHTEDVRIAGYLHDPWSFG
jgi:diaminohydroxyphosphoribosylaminopyrimidine deaminase/5-amino-6-(5-phosphoribosylamino)uracil reductase